MSKSKAVSGNSSVLVAILVITPILFLAAIPWLKDQPDWMALTFGGLAALIEISGAMILAARKDRQSDEWHRGASRFGSQWGWLVGAGLVPLLLVLPPVQQAILAFAKQTDGGVVITEKAALLTFLLGFVTVVLLQTLFTAIFTLAWRFWMSRAV